MGISTCHHEVALYAPMLTAALSAEHDYGGASSAGGVEKAALLRAFIGFCQELQSVVAMLRAVCICACVYGFLLCRDVLRLYMNMIFDVSCTELHMRRFATACWLMLSIGSGLKGVYAGG